MRIAQFSEPGEESGPMASNPRYRPPIVWRSLYENAARRSRLRFVLTNLVYLAVIGSLVLLHFHTEERMQSLFSQKRDLEDLKTKEMIYSIMKSKGISLNQGLDIADTIINQSRALDIPIPMILAVMKKESNFDPQAVSSRKALGLMQVHPVTWNESVSKLKLNVSTNAAFDPVTNVLVGTYILAELRDDYKKTSRSESGLWQSVLSAYYAGKKTIAQNGIQSSHKKYVADVNRFKGEFDKILAE
jgi:soluble lytic murein transglycosylase-like protein